MAEVIWKDTALDDLKDILGFVAKQSAAYAETLRASLMEATRPLHSSPRMGRVVPEFGEPHIRELVVRRYRIIYVIRDDTCYVSAVVYSGRDLATALRPEELENP